MYISTVKKSNTIINPLKKTSIENLQQKQNTFLFDDNNKKTIKNNSNKQLIYTKSDIGFFSKCNDDYNGVVINNNNNNKRDETYNIKKEAFLQKLKDMIFSPGDINYNEKESEYKNNNNNINNNILNCSNRTKSSDKLFDLRKNENGSGYNNNNNNNYNTNNNNKLISNMKGKNLININNSNSSNNNRLCLLPKKIDNKKTLVLDLDETLIHSSFEQFNQKDDIKLKMKIKNEDYIIHVLKRPYLDDFLKIVTEKYEVVIFTASISDYANPLLDKLDPFHKISYRLFRENCTRTDNGLFIKDLNKLGRNLKDVIIIDNNPVSYTLNKMNGLPILTWHSIQSDNELIKLIPLLLYLTNVDDIRTIINKVVNGYYVNYKEVNKLIKNNNNNNNNTLNTYRDEDDYFNDWFVSRNKKAENKKNENGKNTIKDKDNGNIDKYKDQDKDTDEDKLKSTKINENNKNKNKDKQQKEFFEDIIKYKGLLGSEEKINFGNYKKNHHFKIFSGFLINEGNGKKVKKDEENNKQSLLNDLEKNNKDIYTDKDKDKDNSFLIFNQQLENKRNNSSKHLFKVNKKLNNLFKNNESDINPNNNFFHTKDITPIKNNKSKDNIQKSNFFNFEYENNNSKLNKTDANISLNYLNHHNMGMNNNKDINIIINNNPYLINNKITMAMVNSNSNTIEHSSRNVLGASNNKNSIFKNGYQSANYFFQKKERQDNRHYNEKQNNNTNNNNILAELIDNLISYNKGIKKKNIDSNQLIAISNTNKYLINDNIKNVYNNNNKNNNIILNNIKSRRELYDKYNSRNKESFNSKEDNKNIINAFINNRLNINNISNINTTNSYKKNNGVIYLNTGNNYENYIQKNKKGTFLYEDNTNKYNFRNIKEINNLRINDNYSNIGQSKPIKYLSPTSIYKIDL